MYASIDELWSDAVRACLVTGDKLESRVGGTREVVGWSGKLLNPSYSFLMNRRRQLDPVYCAAEVLWYLDGDDSVDMIANYAPQYTKFANNGVAHGSYGRRLTEHRQLSLIMKILKTHPNSRQAIASLWGVSDLAHALTLNKNDLPCTIAWQFVLRNDKLHMIGYMRSNDVWLGLPYDVFAFTSVQRLMACELGVEVGTYTHHVGSLHLYDRNETAAYEATDKWAENLLSHGWPMVPMVEDIPTALQYERQGRLEGKAMGGMLDAAPMLKDFVELCNRKNGLTHTPLFSPALKEGWRRKYA